MESGINGHRRILVVEDEPVIGNVCQKVLTRQGFSVDVVSDGNKAIDNIHDRRYDLCILDLRMPGIDGIQLYKYLADNSPALSQSVIFTTGDITSNQVSGFLNGSERVYLEKPFTPRELIAAVEMALN
ncbi:MAG TPA: response regulator [Dehalococcoidales bacterium]|nr:response regulator [Dehalococcoidales bacterium]